MWTREADTVDHVVMMKVAAARVQGLQQHGSVCEKRKYRGELLTYRGTTAVVGLLG
jgi:hypothetical protein